MCKSLIIILIAAILSTPLQTTKAYEVGTTPRISIKDTHEAYSAPTATVADIATDTVIPVKVAVAPVLGTNDAMQFIFQHESGGRLDAVNAGGCIGLGQDCNGRLATVCPNWRTDRDCQMSYWQGYMASRYGTWEKAAAFWQARTPINGRDVGTWW